MDKIIIGTTDDPNYIRIGRLADGQTVYKYIPPTRKPLRIDEQVIEDYNKTVKIKDTETQELLDKFKWDDLKDEQQQLIKEKIAEGYVEIYPETNVPVVEEEIIERPKVNTNVYTSTLKDKDDKQKLKEDKKKQLKEEYEKKLTKKSKQTKPKKAKKDTTPVDEDIDTSHYTSGFKKDIIVEEVKEEPIKEEQTKPTSKSLIDSYAEAREKEREIEERSSEDVGESIADYYRDTQTSDTTSEDKGEVLGYLDDPEDKTLPVTDDTTEYLSEAQQKDIEAELKDKEREQRLKKGEVIEEEVDDPFKEDVEVVEKEEADTTDYLDLFKSQEEQEEEKEREEERIKAEHVEKVEKEEEEKEKITEEYKKKGKEHRDKISDRSKKARESLKEKKEELSKEYFRGLLEKAYSYNDALVDFKYRQIKNDIEEKRLQKREAAIGYLNQLYKLTEEQKESLRQFEIHLANQRQRVEDDYEKILIEQSKNEDQGIYDEFNDYTTRINVDSKTVTVTNKDTGAQQSFTYTGSLHTYKVDGYRLQLQAISKDPSTMVTPHAPGQFNTEHGRDHVSEWFVTHFFITYDLRDGSMIENESYTFVKADYDRDVADDDYDYDFGTANQHGIFAFTTGYGALSCGPPGLSGTWSTDVSPPNSLSAIAPDGWHRGSVHIGVERLGGTVGAVTVRYLVSAGGPGAHRMGPNDYLIDDDSASSPGHPVGSGAYNYCYQAADSEVAFVSGNGYTYETDPLSGSLQTLTWNDGEAGVKTIDIKHCQLGSSNPSDDGYSQNGYRWYSVYLTLDQTYNMGLSARPGSDDDGYRYHNTRVPSLCTNIAPILGDSYGGLPEPGGLRGSLTSPFFVAISGWGAGQVDEQICGEQKY